MKIIDFFLVLACAFGPGLGIVAIILCGG